MGCAPLSVFCLAAPVLRVITVPGGDASCAVLLKRLDVLRIGRFTNNPTRLRVGHQLVVLRAYRKRHQQFFCLASLGREICWLRPGAARLAV